MSQIIKRTAAAGLALAGAGAGVTTAQANEGTVYDQAVVRATELSGDGGLNVYRKSASSTSMVDTTELNALASNIVETSGGVVSFDTDNIVSVVNVDVEATKRELLEIQRLVAEYNRLRNILDSQVETMAQNQINVLDSLNLNISGDIPTVKALLEEGIAAANSAVTDNKGTIAGVANMLASSGNTTQFELAILEANQAIANASSTSAHTDAGLTGVMDVIKRASDDSAAANGVVVDNASTRRVNNISSAVGFETIKVNTLQELATARDGILAEIRNQAASNNDQTSGAAAYKGTSLRNIADINEWLAMEKKRAAEIADVIAKNSEAPGAFAEYKESYLATLRQAREEILQLTVQSVREKSLASVDAAIANIENSKIDVVTVADVSSLKDVDFGNIGRPTSEVDAIEAQASKMIDDIVNQHMQGVIESNRVAMERLNATKAQNGASMAKFLADLEKAKVRAVTQVSDEWVEARQIYGQSPAYQSYIKQALAQTQAQVDGVVKGVTHSNGVTIKHVDANTSAATASAAEYKAQSGNGFDNGFGTPMLPSKNANDFVRVRGRKLANSQSFAGGAKGIMDTFPAKIRATSAPAFGAQAVSQFVNGPIYQDILNQHINVVGNENVFLVVSHMNEVTLDLNDSFVYVDENGTPHTTGMTLNLKITSDDGGDINQIVNRQQGGFGVLNTVYFFYVSVDPLTGALVTGGGAQPFLNYDGRYVGAGNAGGGGGGEGRQMALSADNGGHTDDPLNLVSAPSSFFSWYDEASAADYDYGLKLHTKVAVNPAAGKWAEYAPLYISDIDDGQFLEVNGGENLTVYMSGQGARVDGGPAGKVRVTSSDLGRNNGANGTTNIDSQSVLIFGPDTNPGFSTDGVAIGHASGGRGRPYQSIDVALFAPFGVVGNVTPEVNLSALALTVDTFTMQEPSAIAKTEFAMASKNIVRTIVGDPGRTDTSGRDMSLNIKIPMFEDVNYISAESRVSSNTSFVVKQLANTVKRTSYGNSMILRVIDNERRTASGNSLVARFIEPKAVAVASGNSLAVRILEDKVRSVSSGNGFTIRQLDSIPEITTLTSPATVSAKPVTVTGKTVNMSVYVDPAVRQHAETALAEWGAALATKGIDLQPTFTSDVNELKKGVTLAIFEADNTTTRLDLSMATVNVANDSEFEMTGLGGLATDLGIVSVVDVDSDDKFNRSGTVKTADVVKSAAYAVQLNTSPLTAKQSVSVLTHEIGHVFGLEHDDDDSLMATYVDDPDFTGAVSEKSASLAAVHILTKLKRVNIA